MEQSLRVALFDSDSDVRFGRRMLLSTKKNFEVVLDAAGEISDFTSVAEGLVDVLVLDQRLVSGPGVFFYSSVRDTIGIKQAPACVITTAFSQPWLILAALEVGVSSVISIEQGPEVLLRAIEQAGAKEHSWSLEQLFNLVSSEPKQTRLDLDLMSLIEELPEKLAGNLRRLRSVWVKGRSKQLQDYSLANLDGLVARLPVRSGAELVIRLERSGLLGV